MDVFYCIEVILTGLILIAVLRNGDYMDKLNQAIARLQASANAISLKVDELKAGQADPVALEAAANALNAVSDQLDGKIA